MPYTYIVDPEAIKGGTEVDAPAVGCSYSRRQVLLQITKKNKKLATLSTVNTKLILHVPPKTSFHSVFSRQRLAVHCLYDQHLYASTD